MLPQLLMSRLTDAPCQSFLAEECKEHGLDPLITAAEQTQGDGDPEIDGKGWIFLVISRQIAGHVIQIAGDARHHLGAEEHLVTPGGRISLFLTFCCGTR